MFRGTLQKDLLTVLFSSGSKPLATWETKAKSGHIKRIADSDIVSLVLELRGTNVATTYITAPRNPKVSLGVKLPFLSMMVKNLSKYFTFEVTILDDKNMRRRFRFSNYQSAVHVRPFCCSMPVGLNPGWNQIQLNLADITRRSYGTTYVDCVRIQIHANCRIRRVFFSDHLYSESELPTPYRMRHSEDPNVVKQQQMIRQQQAIEQLLLQQEQAVLEAQNEAVV